jgi:hypothetical protein
MALWRARPDERAATPPEPLIEALCAAELGEPCDLSRIPSDALHELFAQAPRLRRSVPFAAVRLLGRLATDGRADVRADVAHALAWFVEAYPDRIEELLLLLACDPSRKVRHAAAVTLAHLLPRVSNPGRMIATWENEHPDRARETMATARRSLPPPLGV